MMNNTICLGEITVQGDVQEAFEVYADESKEQTIGFVYDDADAIYLAKKPEIIASLQEIISDFKNTVSINL